MPLRQANSELSEKSGMLQVEKKLLEEEIKRWKARTQVCAETKSTAVLSRNSDGYICYFMTLWKQVHSFVLLASSKQASVLQYYAQRFGSCSTD